MADEVDQGDGHQGDGLPPALGLLLLCFQRRHPDLESLFDFNESEDVNDQEGEEGEDPHDKKAGDVDVVEDVLGVHPKAGDLIVVDFFSVVIILVEFINLDQFCLEELWDVESECECKSW